MLRDRSLVPLSKQHHNGLSLCVLTERALGEDAGEQRVARLARKVINRYEIELANHFGIEEEVLFPLSDSPLIAGLVADHRSLEGMVEQLRSRPTATLLREFTDLLRTHIRREENELFEEMQRVLPRETLDTIGTEIEARAVQVCL